MCSYYIDTRNARYDKREVNTAAARIIFIKIIYYIM